MGVFVSLLMYVMKHFIGILTDFMTRSILLFFAFSIWKENGPK